MCRHKNLALLKILFQISPDPVAWYVGQFVKYILRPNNQFEKVIDKIEEQNVPKAAIQVRRTDKNSEAEFQSVPSYFEHLEEYYDIQDAIFGDTDSNL